MFHTRITWLMLMFTASAVSATPLATLTFLQGQADLIRGTQRYTLSEGVKLNATDIVSLKGNLVQIEMADGAIILLAPDTRIMLLPSRGKAPRLYLQQGALKALTQHAISVNTANWELNLNNGAMAAHTQAMAAGAFLERGSLKLIPPKTVKAAAIELKSGEFYQTAAAESERLLQRPTPAFIGALPRPFLDTPASRLLHFDKPVEPKPAGSFSYVDVAEWLTGPEAIRQMLLPTWRSKASEPAFRAALQANMSKHMEWDRIVNPQKYEKKPTHY